MCSAIPIATRRSSRRSPASTCRSRRSQPGPATSASRSAANIARKDPGSSGAIPADRRPNSHDEHLVGRQLPADQRQLQREGSLSRDGRCRSASGSNSTARCARPTIRPRAMSRRGSSARPGSRSGHPASASRARATSARPTSTNCSRRARRTDQPAAADPFNRQCQHAIPRNDGRQSQPAPRKGGFVERRRGAAAALPARLQRLGRLVPHRAEGRDRPVLRAGHHQPLLRGADRILLGLHDRHGQRQPGLHLQREPVQLRQAERARHRFRRQLPPAAEPGVRRCRRIADAARAGDALHRQHHRLRGSGVIPVDIVGQNGGGGLPRWIYRVSATLRRCALLAHRDRPRDQRGNVQQQLHRMRVELPGQPPVRDRLAIPDDRQQPHFGIVLRRPQPDHEVPCRNDRGPVLRQRDQPVQSLADAGARGRPVGEQHL